MRALLAFALDHFSRQPQIGIAAGAFEIVEKRRLAMARRFGNADISRDDGLIDLRSHMGAHIGFDSAGGSLVRAELLKIRTTRAWWALLIVLLATATAIFVVPMLVIMAVGPLLRWRRDSFARVAKRLFVPALLGLVLAGDLKALAPTNLPRTDLATTFLTGITGVNKPANVVGAEMLRLNTAIPPVPFAQQNRLGIVGNILAGGNDNAGFPNGRRPKDDVVDISLVAVMGGLCMANGNGNALELAVRLEAHPGVERVHYPGLDSHPSRRAQAQHQRQLLLRHLEREHRYPHPLAQRNVLGNG